MQILPEQVIVTIVDQEKETNVSTFGASARLH